MQRRHDFGLLFKDKLIYHMQQRHVVAIMNRWFTTIHGSRTALLLNLFIFNFKAIQWLLVTSSSTNIKWSNRSRIQDQVLVCLAYICYWWAFNATTIMERIHYNKTLNSLKQFYELPKRYKLGNWMLEIVSMLCKGNLTVNPF